MELLNPEQRINAYMTFYGFDSFVKKQLEQKDVQAVINIAELDMPDYAFAELPYIKMKELLERGKAFCSSKLLFHNVGLLTDERLYKTMKKAKVDDLDGIARVYNNAAISVSPFKMPPIFKKENLSDGSLRAKMFYLEDYKEMVELLSKINIYYAEIKIPMVYTDLGAAGYVHELTHTQIKHQRGIVDNYYDDEVLSIFMELLYAYEHNKLYIPVLMSRIRCLCGAFTKMYLYQTGALEELAKEKSDYDDIDYLSGGKYVFSILKAFKLLDVYLNGNYSIKKDILIRIQSVFDGVKRLGETLESLDVNYESSLDSNVTKRLLTK